MTKGTAQMNGCWNEAQIAVFMDESRIPLRLAVNDATECPLVLSLWFLYDDGAIWCATNARARVIGHLAREGRCGFELAGDMPPYRGVRGKGRANLHPDMGGEILERLIVRYGVGSDSRLATMLLARIDEEVAIRISPERFSSWDFSQRMKGAVAF